MSDKENISTEKIVSDLLSFYQELNCPIPEYDYVNDINFNSFIKNVDDGLNYALRVSCAVYTMAIKNEMWSGLIDIYKSILRFNLAYKIHKMPESQRGYAIAFIFSDLIKSIGKEPEYYMSDFPTLYGMDYQKEAKEIITGVNNAMYGETGVSYGKVKNKVRTQFNKEYTEAVEKVNKIIAKIYAGDTDNIYIVYDDILDHLNIQSGTDAGSDEFGGAIVVASLNDICNDLLEDDEYAKKQFDKYYTVLPKDIILVKEKEAYDQFSSLFFEISEPKDVYLVKHNDKTIGLSYESFRLAKLNAMVKNKRQ